MKELAALAYRDTTAENREFWKNEMGQALSEIQQVYEDKLESMRSEMETFYNLKVMIPGLFRCSPQTPLATGVFSEFVGPPQDILAVAQHVLLRRKFFNIFKKNLFPLVCGHLQALCPTPQLPIKHKNYTLLTKNVACKVHYERRIQCVIYEFCIFGTPGLVCEVSHARNTSHSKLQTML